MGQIFRNRQVAGNICLVVFLAFVFTLIPGQLWTSKAYAAQEVAAEFNVTASGANKSDAKSYEIEIDPVTESAFASTIEVLAAKISGTVNNLVYKVTYEKVYGVVYSVYLWYYGVNSGNVIDDVYAWAYDSAEINKSVYVPVKVWKPKKSGGSGGSSYTPPVETPKPPIDPATVKPFTDVQGHWAQSIIEKLVAKGLLAGVADGKFAPKKAVTRAEFTVILARAFNLKAASSNSFADIKPVAWYAAQIAAAKEAGIVKGYGTKFKPNETISREEMAVMTARALRSAKALNLVTATEAKSVIAKYSDKKKVSSWSAQAIASLVKGKVMEGQSAKTLAPTSTANRAEAATLVYSMLQKSGKL